MHDHVSQINRIGSEPQHFNRYNADYQPERKSRNRTQSGLKQQCCALCGALLGEPVEIAPHDHNPGEWKTVLAPDCEREGEKVKSCTVCGNVVVNVLFPTLALHFHEWFDIH